MKLELIDQYNPRGVAQLEAIRELEAVAFIDSPPVDADHAFWLATVRGKPAGFCSAVFHEWMGCVFLSRAAVRKDITRPGSGLHRRMIGARVEWARTLVGCNRVVTYCSPRNYPSLVNLLRCGFRFYEPTAEGITPYGVAGAHYFRLYL